MKLTDALNQLKINRNYRLGKVNTDKFAKTHNNKYAKRALYHFDKAEDQSLIATAPHTNKKDAKAFVKERREKIEKNRMNDYLKNGVGKEFYED